MNVGNRNLEKQVYEACINANIDTFVKILNNLHDDLQKKELQKQFYSHMRYISNFILNSDFWKTGKVSESFIKNLHKIHYPPNYVETKKNNKGEDVVFMIPGEYKKYPNFPRVSPAVVSFEMKKLIRKYNKNISKVPNKKEFIGSIILDFLRIHPFGHGNGVIASLLLDLLLIKNNLKPIGLKAKYVNLTYKKGIYNVIEKSIKDNNLYYWINYIFNHY